MSGRTGPGDGVVTVEHGAKTHLSRSCSKEPGLLATLCVSFKPFMMQIVDSRAQKISRVRPPHRSGN